ncbi:MAG: alpha/beta fold hydrolase [Acidimicrobiales bacterium]
MTMPPVTRNLSPWYARMVALSQTSQIDPIPESDDEIPGWLDRVRARVDALLDPSPQPVGLDLEVTETVDTPNYKRERIIFDAEANMSVPAYLLTPHDRTSPGAAILALHGHGPGKAQVVGLEHTQMPNADYAHQLAERGYVVLAPDLRCFGERLDYNPEDHYACDTNLVHAVMAGTNPLSENLFDLGRCLDVLESHQLVDPARIGMVGLSYGATCALFLAAIDERIAAAVVSGYFSSWAEAHKMPWNMCGSQVLFGMLGQIEHVDVAALIAPRPVMFESGTEDYLFPVAVATAGVSQLRRVYTLLGNPEGVQHDIFEGEHQWHGVAAYDFLERWLGNPRS